MILGTLNAHNLIEYNLINFLPCEWLHSKRYLQTKLRFVVRYEAICRNTIIRALQWRHNEHDSVPNHRLPDCLLRRRSKKISKLSVTGLCAGNSPVTVEFPAQMASISENVSIWWRHHSIATAQDTNNILQFISVENISLSNILVCK